MGSLTLAIPKSLKQEMELFPETKWSEVAREAIKKKIILLKQFEEFAKNQG